MVQAFRAFFDFCYTARRAYLTEGHLDDLSTYLKEFHQCRRIFTDCETEAGIWITAPRQHLMVHYPHIGRLFGALQGLCTSMTESKHIEAVKKPYRRSSHHEALVQMMLVNQRLEKLAACRRTLRKRGLLCTTVLEDALTQAKQQAQEDVQELQDRLRADQPASSSKSYTNEEANTNLLRLEYDIDDLISEGQLGDTDDDGADENAYAVPAEGANEERRRKHRGKDGDDNGVNDALRTSSHVFLAQGHRMCWSFLQIVQCSH